MKLLRTFPVILCGTLLACSHDLSHENATHVINSSALIRPADHATVEAISTVSDTESIVRAMIAGQTTNLKFRRYDAGWTWEFVETKGGGWISPDQAMAQIRESQRQAAAVEWAKKNRDAYEKTAAAMAVLIDASPNPKIGMDAVQWMRVRNLWANINESAQRLPDWRERAVILRNEAAADAWGHEFLVSFSDSERRIVLVSVGPDGKPQTEDDLIGIGVSRPVFESGDVNYSTDKSWRIPEGLGDVVEKLTDRPRGTIEYSKVLTPQ